MQKGRKVKIDIKKTVNKGWGECVVYSERSMHTHASSQVYSLGKVFPRIRSSESMLANILQMKKAQIADRELLYPLHDLPWTYVIYFPRMYDEFGRTYLFDIDFWHLRQEPHWHGKSEDWETKFCVDAFHAGNVSFYQFSCECILLTACAPSSRDSWSVLIILFAYSYRADRNTQNHSCDPNCVIVAVYINEANIDKPLLTIWSCKDVTAGEELCFSYVGDPDDLPKLVSYVSYNADGIY